MSAIKDHGQADSKIIILVLFKMILRVACVLACAWACARGECGGGKGSAAQSQAHLTVATQRNATGQWNAQVRLHQEASSPARMPPLQLDVRPAFTRCGPQRSHALTVTLTLTLSEPPLVLPGYTELDGFSYYRLHEESVSWNEAKAACEAEGAHLLVLNSEAEASAVLTLIQRHPSVTSWIHVGFEDKVKEGHFVTIFGETLAEAGYTRWNVGEPNNQRDGNCGSISAKTMGLNDLHCVNSKFPFICEQNNN